MPVVAADASPGALARAAADADARAAQDEAAWRRLAYSLWAAEALSIRRALDRATTSAATLATLERVRAAYAAPGGAFVRAWVRGALPLIESAAREAQVTVARAAGVRVPATLAPATVRMAEARAEALAAEVCATTASPLAAVERVLAAEARTPAPPVPPVPPGAAVGAGPPNPADALWAQRQRTLEPLVGKEAAAEMIATVRRGREAGQSVAKIARALTKEVHATEVTRTRATRIARTETIGAAAGAEYHEAVATGVLRFKRWLDNKDDRVRASHVACTAQGWIPIRERFVNGLAYVGERPAPPEEVINCRCTVVYAADTD